jgi:hypothetical protein
MPRKGGHGRDAFRLGIAEKPLHVGGRRRAGIPASQSIVDRSKARDVRSAAAADGVAADRRPTSYIIAP